MGLTAVILGSAAGGGFPQWNCFCPVCQLAWGGDSRVKCRSQTSVAVSADGEIWVLLNASPDLRAQILATPALHPRLSVRNSPIASVILTGAEIDQTAGLFVLRERQPFELFATAETHALVANNPMFDALQRDIVSRRVIDLGDKFSPANGIEAELFAVPGKVPLYLEDQDLADGTGVNVGVELRSDAARLAFVPAAAAIPPELKHRLANADVLLFDGTLYDDNEMIRNGSGAKTGRRMGHLPIAGPEGTLTGLANLPGRRILIHINNTNPILVEDSVERAHVMATGWEVAEDGLEIKLCSQ